MRRSNLMVARGSNLALVPHFMQSRQVPTPSALLRGYALRSG
jgi:hypothetical protein